MATEEKTLLTPLTVVEDRATSNKAEKVQPDKKFESKGIGFHRRNTEEGGSPYDLVTWTHRDAEITSDNGESVFKQSSIEVPESWSQTALNIVASKYFHGALDTPERESSVRKLVSRVVDSITEWGSEDGYFRTSEDADIFRDELAYLLLTQKAAFNSPVWFNCGIEAKPQCSACFINSVDDSMESILNLAKTEGMLFKYGSGTGTNFSSLRSSKEQLSTGGYASGPVSFMKGFDAFAGVIKSGGKTRRAAKMVILDISHPDIEEFITSKLDEEKKAWALIDSGFDGKLNGEAYSSVFFQNANHSIRVSDDFMQTVVKDGIWETKAVTTGKTVKEYKARELFKKISEAAWACGDPGMQYDTTINTWHTCKNSGRINASNPCSEFMFLDDTACNLASLNLLSFMGEDGIFDVEAFTHAIDIMITAQEIIVDNSSYPRDQIAENSHLYRPLGLGYANLGALLMYNGLPYDSEAGREYASAITSIMTGQAYLTSARLAAETGPFPEFSNNREPMMEVIRQHRKAGEDLNREYVPEYLYDAAQSVWKQAEKTGTEHGYRNSQVTVLAPTGTIGFMMDCDTTGIEPELALVKYKRLSGGGKIKLVNKTIPEALKRFGYDPFQIDSIIDYIEKVGTIEGISHLQKEHLPVFDCAFKPTNGSRSIHHMGHVKMMAAVQPFLSGAISKTVNLPSSITPEEIEQIYIDAWKLGVKAIAVYRDGCKRTQPLSTEGEEKNKVVADALGILAQRHRLPIERQAITHKFEVGGHEGYATVGLYENGSPGEIFLVMAKEGSTVSGLMDCFATAISIALQYGVPLKVLVNKFTHTRFEPSGWTKNKQIPHAKSVMDYLFRWLSSKFLSKEEQEESGVVDYKALAEANGYKSAAAESDAAWTSTNANGVGFAFQNQEDAPSCPECGEIMVRNGACYKCLNCGSSEGCS